MVSYAFSSGRLLTFSLLLGRHLRLIYILSLLLLCFLFRMFIYIMIIIMARWWDRSTYYKCPIGSGLRGLLWKNTHFPCHSRPPISHTHIKKMPNFIFTPLFPLFSVCLVLSFPRIVWTSTVSFSWIIKKDCIDIWIAIIVPFFKNQMTKPLKFTKKCVQGSFSPY